MKNFFIKKNIEACPAKLHLSRETSAKWERSGGFTLIEMMIAVALFSVIMVIGIGAVLSANNAHKKTQNVRAILDNLSFVMEEMSRNLRTGTNYHCDIRVGTISDPLDGLACPSIAFESAGGDPSNRSDQWQYLIGQDSTQSPPRVRVYKNTSTVSYQPITPLDIDIDINRSGFTVVGACPITPVAPVTCSDSNNPIQPKVIIRLSGLIKYQNTNTPFDLQTTVSQRVYDN